MALATAGEAWIERAYWKEQTNDFLTLVLALFVYWPITFLKWVTIFVGAVCAIVAIPFMFEIFSEPLRWQHWLGFVLCAGGPFVFFRLLQQIEPTIKTLWPDQFINVLYLLISSRGLVIVASYAKPLFLPWSCIAGYSFMGDITTLTSQLMVEYTTADGQIATIVLDGEEYKQPLGEICQVLQARVGLAPPDVRLY